MEQGSSRRGAVTMAFLIGQTIGDYTILQELGNGASGVVYKVEQTITGRREAMKILGGGTTHSPEQAERFMREIRLQASLAHPNIAAVHNAFLANDDLVLICELLQGDSLQSLLARGPVPLTHGVDLVTQVLAALSYAHAHGVMHRDVSPANIFVTTDKTVKLIDFGLAKGAADVRLTREGSPQGSVHYMSPEQVRGLESLDVRTDIYSCGAVLYHLATGRTLFESESAFDVMKGHLEVEPPRPRSINPNISAKLEAIILQSVAKKAEDRFQSADSFYQALKQAGAECSQPSFAPPAWRRNSSIFAGASACLCLVFAGLADPISVTGRDNTLAKNRAIVKSHAVIAPLVRTTLQPQSTPTVAPQQRAPRRAINNPPAAIKSQNDVKEATLTASREPVSPVSPAVKDVLPAPTTLAAEVATPDPKQHPVKKFARTIQRLNPFSRKSDPDKSASSR